MDPAMLIPKPVLLWRELAVLGFTCLGICLVAGQSPPGKMAPGPPELDPGRRIVELGQSLDLMKPVNAAAQRALQSAKIYLQKASAAHAGKREFAAGRLIVVADSLRHVAEHQQHIRDGGGPKGPPSSREVAEHLPRIYFRVQQADYFYRRSRDVTAVSFSKWAHEFYQLARRAYDRRDWLAADENGKCAEDLVRALEALAQASTPIDIPPPAM